MTSEPWTSAHVHPLACFTAQESESVLGQICERLLLEADLTLDRPIQVAVKNAMANDLPNQRLHIIEKDTTVCRGTQEI